ncbi:unnamed protein product [Knipowitschia caucasica]
MCHRPLRPPLTIHTHTPDFEVLAHPDGFLCAVGEGGVAAARLGTVGPVHFGPSRSLHWELRVLLHRLREEAAGRPEAVVLLLWDGPGPAGRALTGHMVPLHKRTAHVWGWQNSCISLFVERK